MPSTRLSHWRQPHLRSHHQTAVLRVLRRLQDLLWQPGPNAVPQLLLKPTMGSSTNTAATLNTIVVRYLAEVPQRLPANDSQSLAEVHLLLHTNHTDCQAGVRPPLLFNHYTKFLPEVQQHSLPKDMQFPPEAQQPLLFVRMTFQAEVQALLLDNSTAHRNGDDELPPRR